MRTIQQALSPGYFISYSRVQEAIAAALRTRLDSECRAIWFDRDCLGHGDNWLSEIRRGIAECDELILLLSNASVQSRVVAEEVQTAISLHKAVRPILIERIVHTVPEAISRYQFLDVSGRSSAEALAMIAEALSTPAANFNDRALKVAACRGICPPFIADFASPVGRATLAADAAELERLATLFPPQSVMWLNAGLAACILGDWRRGLERLRAHAHAAATFPAWYLLAIHLPERKSVMSLGPKIVRESLDALGHAAALERHPLIELACAIVETGGQNMGVANLNARLSEFGRLTSLSKEASAEFLRAYWALEPSLPALGPHKTVVVSMLRGLAS